MNRGDTLAIATNFVDRFNLKAHLEYLKTEDHPLAQKEIEMYTAPGFPFAKKPDGSTHQDESFAGYWARQRGPVTGDVMAIEAFRAKPHADTVPDPTVGMLPWAECNDAAGTEFCRKLTRSGWEAAKEDRPAGPMCITAAREMRQKCARSCGVCSSKPQVAGRQAGRAEL